MDKRRRIGGVVALGIGLSLIALGVYVRVVMAGNILYRGPLIPVQILMWSAIVSGIILTVIGGIYINKRRRP